MTRINKVSELKPLDLVVYGDDTLIVMDLFATSFWGMNVDTKEVQLIEGDYCGKGEIDNLFSKGNVEEYLTKFNGTRIKAAFALVEAEIN